MAWRVLFALRLIDRVPGVCISPLLITPWRRRASRAPARRTGRQLPSCMYDPDLARVCHAGACANRPAAVMERRPCQERDRRLRADVDRPGESDVRAAGGSDRDV